MLGREMSPEEQSAAPQAATAKPPQGGGSPRRGRRSFRPQRRPRRPAPGPAHDPNEPHAPAEPVAELPAAEIADSGEPMPANVMDDPVAPVPQSEHPREPQPPGSP